MNLFRLVFLLQFIVKLRFPRNQTIAEVITRRYGRNTWLMIRKWETNLRRWEKSKLDIVFLERCLLYGVTPKFVKFKLYRKELHCKKFYQEWQDFLLRNELKSKRKSSDVLKEKLFDSYNNVKSVVSFLDFNHILHFIHKNVDKYVNKTSIVHAAKLYNLGVFYKPPTVCNGNVITNLSNKPLSKREKWLLSLGLDHCLHPSKPPTFNFLLGIESLHNRLLNESMLPELTSENQ